MNVSLTNIDAVSALLKIEIEKNDYWEQWNKTLRSLRQKAVMPGFRSGMVPIEIIKKRYGKQTKLEEINNLLSDTTKSYLEENQIDYIGSLIQNQTEQIDLDSEGKYEFFVEIALKPKLDFQLTKEDSLTVYRVIVRDEDVEKTIKVYRKQYGVQESGDQVEADDLVKGRLVELVDKTPKEGGLCVEEALLIPSYIKGKMEQKKILNAKTGDTIVFNPSKAFKGMEVEMASFLNIDKEAAKEVKSDFSFTINEISRLKLAEMNQELYDKLFGKDKVSNEADCREKIKMSLAQRYTSQTEQVLQNDIQEFIMQKVADIAFADDILKRWLVASSEKITKEDLERDYPTYISSLKYNLVKSFLTGKYNLNVEKEDIKNMAIQVVIKQLIENGMYSVQKEEVEGYVSDMLKDQATVNQLAEAVLDEKIPVLVKEKITIVEQEVTPEEYNKIMAERK